MKWENAECVRLDRVLGYFTRIFNFVLLLFDFKYFSRRQLREINVSYI